jgi:ferredoxin
MPCITAQGKTFDCELGANLRQELLKQGIPLYNGPATAVNCHGLGTCGTCAVKVEGAVSKSSWRENARRSLPPHNLSGDRRLACQTQVLGDVTVTKYDGIWGQGSQQIW